MKDDSPFVFAGLWEGWKDPASGEAGEWCPDDDPACQPGIFELVDLGFPIGGKTTLAPPTRFELSRPIWTKDPGSSVTTRNWNRQKKPPRMSDAVPAVASAVSVPPSAVISLYSVSTVICAWVASTESADARQDGDRQDQKSSLHIPL
jgi:hypothetical protein